jgi:histidyl-tRNA synthetase
MPGAMLTRAARDLFRQSLFQVMIAGEYGTVNPMSSAKTQPARGMRDFLPADVRKREYVIGVIKSVYERYGFEPLETPAVENIETLMGKYGEEGNQLIFKILKRGEHEKSGEADLALRYDLTVPLARVVAQYQNELPKFFKRYQIQPVWRADRPARGRFREFYQCDVDVLGSKSMVVEAELIAAVSDALIKLRFRDFTIRLNHRGILRAIFESKGLNSDEQTEALTVLDQLKEGGLGPGQPNLRNISTQKLIDVRRDVYRSRIAAEAELAEPEDDHQHFNQLVLDDLAKMVRTSDEGKRGVAELREIIEYTRNTSAASRIMVDPTLARGLSYYTGAIMEITVADLPGSLGGGGRYDNLVGMFLGKAVPACGFSLGLERIIVVMTERNMFPPELVSSPADVMVTIWNEDSVCESLALASELRSGGLRVDLYPEADKMGKQFKYASSRHISFVAILGDDERARGEVAIKDLRSGEQRSVKRNEVAAAIRDKES